MIRSLALILLTAASLAAADLPLGTVESHDDDVIVVAFDGDSRLQGGDMLAIYGPGKVEKHPLTGEVIVEQRQLVAKAQMIGGNVNMVRARLTWLQDGVTIAKGFDAVPLPGEASPDGPPVLTGALPRVVVPAQGSVEIELPIADPEGAAVAYRWQLKGERGATGRLSALSTVEPRITWIAPAWEGTVELSVTASDPAGQSQQWTLPLDVDPLPDGWRQRSLGGFAAFGQGLEPQWVHLVRGDDGSWWGITRDAQVMRGGPGWQQRSLFEPQDRASVRGAVALEPRGRELYVLDERERSVQVFATDGVLRRRLGSFQRPSDLAVGAEGSIFVADQSMGGVVVLEADGRFRCRLGHPGESEDGFVALTRLALHRSGELACLDREGRRVHRFDRQHRRLPSWQIQTDGETWPVDLAWHAKGLLVLLSDGSIQVFETSGVASQALKPLSTSGWFERLSEPRSIAADQAGSILVCYPDDGLVQRYGADGQISGVRGTSLWTLQRFAVDGGSRIYGMDERTGLISVFDREGWLSTRFGGTERYGGPLERPGPMAVSADGRQLFVVDTGRVAVMRFDTTRPQGRPLIFGQQGENDGQFEEPVAIAVDGDQNCYIVDADLHRVAVFDGEGSFLYNFGHYQRGKTADELIAPTRIAVTDDGATAYIYDSRRYEVMKFELDPDRRRAKHVNNAGGRGTDLGQFAEVNGLACDRLGLLYALDERRRDLQVLDFRGTNAVAVIARELEDLGLRRPTVLALTPDGLPWIAGDERLIGLRWQGAR